ncbi:hypothetical protein ACFQ07_28305, partial [Actinomadura adrarensis]
KPTPAASARPKRLAAPVIPAGYGVRSVFNARLAVPSHYLNHDPKDGYRLIFMKPPGQQDEQIIVCNREDMPEAPRGAAARAEFWKERFLSNPGLRNTRVSIKTVTVNGRAAKMLTVNFEGDDGRIWHKMEMYYSGPEGEWKIVSDFEMASHSEKVNDSIFMNAIRTFRV